MNIGRSKRQKIAESALVTPEKSEKCIAKTDSAAAAVEEKFATYWPRNIMILFGPPVSCMKDTVLSLALEDESNKVNNMIPGSRQRYARSQN